MAIKNFDAAMFFGLSEAIQTFGDDGKRVLGCEPELVEHGLLCGLFDKLTLFKSETRHDRIEPRQGFGELAEI